MPRRASCGLDFTSVPNVKAALAISSENGYSFSCFPIVHPRFRRELLIPEVMEKNGAFTRSDLILSSHDWCNMVVGKLSDYYDCDSSDKEFRKLSEACLMQEMLFCTHLGLPAVMFSLHNAHHANLARIVYDKAIQYTSNQFWVHVPMMDPEVMASNLLISTTEAPKSNTWHWWNEFRLMCSMEKKLGVALEVSADLVDEAEQRRWLGEPLKVLILPTSVFLTNKKGFPVLSQAHQAFVKRAANLDVQFIVTGASRHASLKNYLQYIDHLFQSASGDNPVPNSRGFEDHLQIPLQPLMDNLESTTYEVFEKDPVKYTEYQKAMYQALLDRVPLEEADTNVQVIMVVGAGRGPLVKAALCAAEAAARLVRVYAVEKNVNAIVTLFGLKEEVWKDKVTVVAGDMREWKAPEQCDILVSELLGSFGDNELSPECLDGPEKFLKSDGISIPCRYTSYLCPLQSSKLYNEARNNNPIDKPYYARFEMPYVVHQINAYNIAPPQPVFTFHHPLKDKIADHTRYTKLTFAIEQDTLLHGFTGYFDTVLYKDITLSIVPSTYSKGLFSWFPIYFPIKEPVKLLKDSELEVHFWRLADKKNVWYEWSISKPVPIPIHNPNGRSYYIGLF